jgi:hypothetical protein
MIDSSPEAHKDVELLCVSSSNFGLLRRPLFLTSICMFCTSSMRYVVGSICVTLCGSNRIGLRFKAFREQNVRLEVYGLGYVRAVCRMAIKHT